MKAQSPQTGITAKAAQPVPKALLAEVRRYVLEARQQTARMVDAGLTLLYWQIGDRIGREILGKKRAGYGEQIVSALARQLETEFGRGFAEKNLRRMVQFAEVFPDQEIVVSLIRQLTWTHFIALIPIKDRLQREFYSEIALLVDSRPMFVYSQIGERIRCDILGKDRPDPLRHAIRFVEDFASEALSHAM